jgi:hypothetical protein
MTFTEYLILWDTYIGPVDLFTSDELILSGGIRKNTDAHEITAPLDDAEQRDLVAEIISATHPISAIVDEDGNMHYANPLYN